MKKGMTLIETIIGLTIIGIAFYLLMAVFINLAPRTAVVETIGKKALLAQEKMEEYLARSFNQVASVGATSFSGSFSNYDYQIIVTYVATGDLNTAVAGPTKFKNVKVRVWGGPISNSGTIEVVTLVTSHEAVPQLIY
jgi:prepilin-type N-terminal cleavage/methylation domain-containing protein